MKKIPIALGILIAIGLAFWAGSKQGQLPAYCSYEGVKKDYALPSASNATNIRIESSDGEQWVMGNAVSEIFGEGLVKDIRILRKECTSRENCDFGGLYHDYWEATEVENNYGGISPKTKIYVNNLVHDGASYPISLEEFLRLSASEESFKKTVFRIYHDADCDSEIDYLMEQYQP